MVCLLALVLQSIIRGGDQMKRVRVSINIRTDLLDRLTELARQQNMSRSRLIENMTILFTKDMDEGGKDHGEENGRKEA
jgi:metal-responsive CopG/Arc/MetJ family transcriptional regulator